MTSRDDILSSAGPRIKKVTDAVHRLVTAYAIQSPREAAGARFDLQQSMADLMLHAEVLGSHEAIQAYLHTIDSGVRFSAASSLLAEWSRAKTLRFSLGSASFASLDALRALKKYVPDGALIDRTVERLADKYEAGKVMVYAQAADRSIAQEAHRLQLEAIERGLSESQATLAMRDRMAELGAEWSRSYSQTVVRTTTATAYSDATRETGMDPEIREFLPALVYDAVGDSDTRPNHRAMDGVIMKASNPLWQIYSPPLGFRCRCDQRLVPIYELESLGLIDEHGQIVESAIPAGAGPDPGFRKVAA